MENAKISLIQWFALIILFELGSAIVVGLGMSAGKDAWLAILLGMVLGLGVFSIYTTLFRIHRADSFIHLIQYAFGKPLGVVLAFLYVLYFLYLSARVLRDFGELLLTSTYEFTPLFVIHALMILSVVYVVSKGIETLARTGEIYFLVILLLGIAGNLVVWFSGKMEPKQLLPFLENGWAPIMETVFPTVLTFPFGEMITFAILFPYVNRPKKAAAVGRFAVATAGVLLAYTVAIDIMVLGENVARRSAFPLLTTISIIHITGFFQRLDAIVVLTLIIGGFFKIALFFYVAVASSSELFHLSSHQKLTYPLGIVVLIFSMMIASHFPGHIEEGLRVVPLYVHLPFQIGIPFIALLLIFWRKRSRDAS